MRPANGPVHGLLRHVMRGRVGEAFVEHHHDVAPERQLNIHNAFRREEVLITI